MKKNLLFLVFVVLVVAAVGVYFMRKGGSAPVSDTSVLPEESAPELPTEQRPMVSLTPRSDGHWLKLTIANVNRVSGAATVEYVLSYDVPDHPSQGVPGAITLSGVTTIDRDLLLGSESSGKFRYDEGVSHGLIALKFRDKSKKLLGALVTDFHMQSKTDTLTSFDSKFTYKLSRTSTKGFYVTLNTFGIVGSLKGDIDNGPYGVFSSESLKQPGVVTLAGSSLMRFGEGKWISIRGGQSSDIGVFATTK